MNYIKRDQPINQPMRMLVIVAHHDDIEFGVGGSIAKWVESGAEVTYCIVTDGGAGSNDPQTQRAELVERRREEQLRAAEVVGVHDVRFLGYEDGTMQPSLELRRDLTRVIRQVQPNRVLCQDPTTYFVSTFYVNHPDHRAVGEAAMYAVFPSAQTRPIFPELLEEGYEPHSVDEVYFFLSNEPTHYVDISDYLELKLQSLGHHKSQFSEDDKSVEKTLNMVREWSQSAQEQLGVGAAEYFRVMRLNQPSTEAEDDTLAED